jgi:electron transfer flavoprotein alpha subunit
MSGVLVVAEVREGKVFSGTLSAITFAKDVASRTGSHFDIVVTGSGVGDAAKELAGYGARKILVEDAPVFEHYLAQSHAHSVAAAAKNLGSSFVTAVATTTGKDLLPRVAVKLGAGMVSEIVGVAGEQDGKLVYKRPMWAGNIIGHVVCSSAITVVTVRGTDFDRAEPSGGQSEIAALSSGFDASTLKTRFVKVERTESERPDLSEASVVVAGGRGLKDDKGFYGVMEPLADVLGAAIGASRAAVDSGFCPNDLQIGQTGKVVAPDLYFAVAISGAIQHLAGMKNSKTIVAINKDAEAPIFQIADYGLVGDAFKLVPELVEKIKAKR